MKKLRTALMTVSCFISFIGIAQVPFTKGNIVVVRVGDGSVPLKTGSDGTSASATYPVFLDEFTSSGALVQSVPLPTTINGANQRLTLNGFSETISYETGTLNLSPNGQWLAIAGYNLPSFFQGDLDDPGDRTIGIIDYNASINTTTLLTDIGFSLPYSAITTNGSDIWTCSQPGIRYSTIGGSISTGLVNTRNLYTTIGISNNQLYAGTRTGILRSIGTGLPTTSGQTITNLISLGFATGQNHFFFADLNPSIAGNDVLYVADLQLGLTKYSFDGTNWVSNGIIGVDTDNYFGIIGAVSGTTVTLYCTRKINEGASSSSFPSSDGSGELVALTDASGYNGAFVGIPTVIATHAFQTVFRGLAFAPQPPSVKVSAKAFLQGAYSSITSRHKDVTATWAAILNANATNQPYNTAAFGNYNGGESVSNTFFASNTANDVVDWVLIELRNKNNPATLVSRKAGFICEDGTIVGTDGNTLTISNAGDDSYYIVIRHRNHLSIRSANPVALNGSTATLYDFTTAQSQAYQNPSVPGNTAMGTKDLLGDTPGVFMMWGGNANSDGLVRASAGATVNDYLTLMSPSNLNGNTSTILSNVYRSVDMNLDGTVRASAGSNVNDYLVLMSPGILNGNTSNILTAH